MYGCEFCKMDKKYNEYCSLTGEPTNGAVMCDFEFDIALFGKGRKLGNSRTTQYLKN